MLLAELIVVANPPDFRSGLSFIDSAIPHLVSFLEPGKLRVLPAFVPAGLPSLLCFRGLPAPDSFDHLRRVAVSYFLARDFPPLLPIFFRKFKTSWGGGSFFVTPDSL